MIINDRLTRGFIAGIIGGIPMNMWNYFSFYVLKFTKLKFIDWMGVLLYSRLPKTLVEILLSHGVHFIFLGALGIVFVYLVTQVTSENLYFKGVLFALVVGFITYSIPKLFHVDLLFFFKVNTVISNLTGGIVWGVAMVKTLKWLDTKRTI